MDTDPVRQLPTGTVPVSGSRFDFGTPRRLGSLTIDYAFRDLDRDDEGRAELRLTRPDGSTVAAWVDRNFPLLEVYAAGQLSPNRRRRGLGVEPTSCPPNALRSGVDVQRLEPGESFRAEWGVRLLE